MKRVLLGVFTLVATLLCFSALGEGITLAPIEIEADDLEYVDKTGYLIARDGDTRLYGVYTTAGEPLIPCEYGLLAYAGYDYFEAINEEGLNNHALLGRDGRPVIGWEYAAFEVLSDRWCLAVALEPTEGELYDYSGGFLGGGKRYLVTRYDVYDLKSGQMVGSLDRASYEQGVAHGDYLYVMDRQDGIHVYDQALSPVEAEISSIYNAYGTADGKAVCLSDGKVIAENASSAYEDTDTGYIKVQGKKGPSLLDAEGNTLVPEGYEAIGMVYDGYALVKQDGLCGLYSLAEGRLAVPCEYDDVRYFGLGTVNRYVHNGYACVEKDGKVGFVDADGNVTCELKYAASGVTQHGCTLTVTDMDGSIYIVAGDGTQTRTEFDEVSEHSGGDGSLLVVRKDDAYGLADWHGNEVLPLEYKSYEIEITDFADAVLVNDALMAVTR